MASDNETNIIEENFMLYNFTAQESHQTNRPNWLESWIWKLEDKLGISSSHGLVIFMILYLLFLFATTLCVIWCYTCLTQRRNRQQFSRSNSNKSNYVKNIQSFYSATGEANEDENTEPEVVDNFDLSSIPSHLIKDVLLQDGDDVSIIEDTNGNDVEQPACDQEILGYSSFDFSHCQFDVVSVDDRKNMMMTSTFAKFDHQRKTSYQNDQKNWMTFDDDSPSDSLNDSDPDVLEEGLEVKRRLELNEDDELLQSSSFEGKMKHEMVNLGYEKDAQDHDVPHPLNLSAVVASQLPC